MTQQRHTRAEAGIAVLLYAAMAAVTFWYNSHPGPGGEGIPAVGAQRILHGELPYRDFWTMYAPGSFYLLAALFKLFGSHLTVARAGGDLIVSLAAPLVFLMA